MAPAVLLLVALASLLALALEDVGVGAVGHVGILAALEEGDELFLGAGDLLVRLVGISLLIRLRHELEELFELLLLGRASVGVSDQPPIEMAVQLVPTCVELLDEDGGRLPAVLQLSDDAVAQIFAPGDVLEVILHMFLERVLSAILGFDIADGLGPVGLRWSLETLGEPFVKVLYQMLGVFGKPSSDLCVEVLDGVDDAKLRPHRGLVRYHVSGHFARPSACVCSGFRNVHPEPYGFGLLERRLNVQFWDSILIEA